MNKLHAPLFLQAPRDRGIVIFIHGFMGSPRQFDKLAAAVHHQGKSVASLLLPGHGGSAKDFVSGSAQRWQDHVDSEVGRFSNIYTDIWLVGHSMGGLLAINTVSRYNGHVRGIFTIACPFKMTLFSLRALKVRMQQVFYSKTHPIKAAYIDSCSVPLSLSMILRTAKPAREVKELMLATREKVSAVSVPVTAVYSMSDELTAIESVEIFKSALNNIPFNQIILTDSLHAYYTENEYSIIEKALLEFIVF